MLFFINKIKNYFNNNYKKFYNKLLMIMYFNKYL